jgi:GT2 family glycosyltransferase
VDPRFAVVVASKDRRDLLLRTLPLHLALPERPEVVLVDDASTDGTAEAVARELPEVRLVRRATSVGGAARNDGLRATRAPYVALADDDSWWEPGSLARAGELFDAHPRLAVIQAKVMVRGEHPDPIHADMVDTPLPPGAGQPGFPVLGFLACGVVVRREALLEAGGFSPLLGVGGEEELLSWDLAATGWQLSYVPELVVHHDPPRVAGGRPHRREVGIRNTLWTTWLRRPPWPAAVRTVRQVRRLPRDRTTARGLARAVAGLPAVLRERRVSPPHVEAQRQLLDDQQLGSGARRYVD